METASAGVLAKSPRPEPSTTAMVGAAPMRAPIASAASRARS
jgi:hypothetical protein